MKTQQQPDKIDKKFLYKENKQLRIQLRQAKQLLKVHKDAVSRLSHPHNQSNKVVSILLDLISQTQMTSKIEKLNQKILGLESHQMVLQKIVEQTDNDEKQTYHILAQQYNKIKQDNQKLQSQLHKFYEKIGEVDYLSGLVTKYKQVILPTQQAVAFKKEQQQLLQFIAMQKMAIRKLTEEKAKLLKINVHMKESVEKHKDEVRNMTMILNSPDMLMNLSIAQNEPQSPGLGHGGVGVGADNQNNQLNILDELNQQQQHHNINNHNVNSHEQKSGLTATTSPNRLQQHQSLNLNTSLFNSSNLNTTQNNRNLNTTINFIKMQRKIIKEQQQQNMGNESDDHDSEDEQDCQQLNILFPDKVQKIKKDKQITKVPYLNMMKIRELMAKRDSKIRKQIQAENRHINPTDKIIKLQTELQITRKQLTSQTLKFRTMGEELKQALKQNQELVYRNDLLMSANERLQANYKNVYKDYQLTKIIALRVERAMGEKLENTVDLIEEINTTKDFEEKLSSTEIVLRKIFGKKVTPNRSQSLNK